MNRRELICRIGTLAGAAAVVPSAWLAGFTKTPSLPFLKRNEKHDAIELSLGINLLANLVFHRDQGKPLLTEIKKQRDLLSSEGWNQPLVKVRDDLTLQDDEYVISVFGSKVISGTALHESRPVDDCRQECVLAAQVARLAVHYQHLWSFGCNSECS